jgi:pimeloyl-ACP methyl ester carboxylesterase
MTDDRRFITQPVTAARPTRARVPVSCTRVNACLAACLAVFVAGCGQDDEPAPPSVVIAPPPTAVGGVSQVAPPQPAWLIDTSVVAPLPKATLEAAAAAQGWTAQLGPVRCDVTLHAIFHPTTGPKGESTNASGAVMVPGGAGCPGPYPLLSYSRGTDLDRNRSMTTPDDRETQAVAAFFAARGWVVVASDYLGYARSTFPYHPYLHAESEARTGIDALRAARMLLSRLGVAESGRLAVIGYSQGGHAALAIERAIERDRPEGVYLPVATGAMSGPYDLSGTFTESVQLLPLLTAPVGSSGTARSALLRLGDVLGTSAAELLQAGSQLGAVLQANSVIGWRPAAPVLLCGGSRDPTVPFSNTVRAAADFAARGATVTVLDVEQDPVLRVGLPPAGARTDELGSYHQGLVPPRCFAATRDRLLEPLR